MTLRLGSWLAIVAFIGISVMGVLLRPLLPIDETRYVAVAWEMWLNGHYLVPTKNFEIYTHKPPLLFWAINLVWAFTGVSEFAARMVGPAAAVVSLLLTGRLAKRLWPEDPDTGPRAVIALAALPVFAILGGLTMFDALLTVCTLAGLLALLAALDGGRWRWWWAVGVAIAFGVLAKGPVILLHLLPAMLTAPIWASGRFEGRGVLWLAKGIGLALAVGLAVVGLWLVPAIISGGAEYRDAILWKQSAGRITESFAHARPAWFFVALLPILLFPWVLVPAVWRAGWSAAWREPGVKLGLIWAATALVAFSLISGKQAHYLVPELPAAALIVARLLREAGSFRPIWAAVPVALTAAYAIPASLGLAPVGGLDEMLQPAAILMGWGLVVAALCWLSVLLGAMRGAVLLTLGGVLSVNLIIGLTGLHLAFSSHPIAGIIAPYQARGIAYIGPEYNAEFNFAARLTAPVATPDSAEALAAWIAGHPDGVIVGRLGKDQPGWPPGETIDFRQKLHGIWHVADADKATSGP